MVPSQAPPTYTQSQQTFVEPVHLKKEVPEEHLKPVKKKKPKKESNSMWHFGFDEEEEEEEESETEEEDWGDEEFQIA